MPADSWTKKLEEVVGPANVSYERDWFRARAWEGALPQAIAFPATREQVCDVMRLASAERLKVAPAGNGTKSQLGGGAQRIDFVLSLARLSRIVDYAASDLTISLEAGIPIREVAATLASHNQMLPLDMPFADRATLGGIIAANSNGPRRFGYGSWRDTVLGIHFATAEGKLAKGGGKVVKNVAGYDLPKLLIGSCGTLAVIVEVTLKVFPTSPATGTFVLGFGSAEQALQASRRILNSPLIPQALDFVDFAAGTVADERSVLAAPCNLVVGVGGPDVVVERFRRELPSVVRAHGLAHLLPLRGEAEFSLWRAIQELTPTFLGRYPGGFVVKASLPLNRMEHFVAHAQGVAKEHGNSVATLARAGSGIIYCHLWGDAAGPAGLAKSAELLLSDAERLGGRAVVEWCPPELRSKMKLWGTLGDDFAWMKKVKAALDPLGILNPGRFYGGI